MRRRSAAIRKEAIGCIACLLLLVLASCLSAGTTTWDGRHSIAQIEVTVVYFVPRDRTPLPDWRQRVDYYCRRLEQFHRREFGGQSSLTTRVHDEPLRSTRSTKQLRAGDANFIFFQTLNEVDGTLKFASAEQVFRILLVLSDINWRPLEDFYRLSPKDGKLHFEGQLIANRHFPGAASGGARATYLAERGVGWGLVSADGWRVPYSGSDCVVYHEGVGHAIGLPHPEPGNNSVMSLGQYHGWINESWLDKDQKTRLGWKPEENSDSSQHLFTAFRALPNPLVPRPGEEVGLNLEWPAEQTIKSCQVRIQTELFGPWLVIPPHAADQPRTIVLGKFDRPTPVSYRVNVELANGQTAELWGYFQVRSTPDQPPLPSEPPPEAAAEVRLDTKEEKAAEEVDLLSLMRLPRDQVSGNWALSDAQLVSPKEYGARVQLPYQPPDEYRLAVIAQPLDEPNGLILGQRLSGKRFMVLVNYLSDQTPASALENVDGKNVNNNATTISAALLKKNQLSQIICTVRKGSVRVSVDGREIIAWQGDAAELSLSDYWKTPSDQALFLGAYDCRYRFYRVSLTPLSGIGRPLASE